MAQELVWLGVASIVFFVAVVYLLQRSIMHAPFSPIHPSVQVSSAAIAQRMLFEDADAFSNRPTTPCVLHPTRLSLHEPIQREAVKGLVAGLRLTAAAGEVVVVRDSIRTAVYALMMRLCFGDDGGFNEGDVRAIDRAQMEFLVAFAGAKEVEETSLPRIVYWRRWLRLDAAFNRLSELVIPLIIAARRRQQQTRRRSGGGGGGFVPYVNSLFNLRVHDDDDDDGPGRMLKEKEMAPLVWEFIVAGAESVASCVEWALAHLVSQPEVQNKLHREVAAGGVVTEGEEHLRSSPYLLAVILECLRMHPTVPFLTREVVGAHAVGLEGEATKTKLYTVIINARDIGRDGKAWTNPDEFWPDRFLAGGEGEGVGLIPGPKQEIKMMPFGAGRRHCPGAGMGMLHIGCCLAALVREFEWVLPPAHQGGGGGVDMTEVDMFFKLMRTPLRVRITSRSK